jgi:hypothetical protein
MFQKIHVEFLITVYKLFGGKTQTLRTNFQNVIIKPKECPSPQKPIFDTLKTLFLYQIHPGNNHFNDVDAKIIQAKVKSITL